MIKERTTTTAKSIQSKDDQSSALICRRPNSLLNHLSSPKSLEWAGIVSIGSGVSNLILERLFFVVNRGVVAGDVNFKFFSAPYGVAFLSFNFFSESNDDDDDTGTGKGVE